MKPNTDSFELIAEGARSDWLAARAAQDIGACVPHRKIPTEEIEELIAYCETILRERRELQPADYYKQKIAYLVYDLTGEIYDN